MKKILIAGLLLLVSINTSLVAGAANLSKGKQLADIPITKLIRTKDGHRLLNTAIYEAYERYTWKYLKKKLHRAPQLLDRFNTCADRALAPLSINLSYDLPVGSLVGSLHRKVLKDQCLGPADLYSTDIRAVKGLKTTTTYQAITSQINDGDYVKAMLRQNNTIAVDSFFDEDNNLSYIILFPNGPARDLLESM